MKIQKINSSNQIIDIPCMETDYVIECFEEMIKDKYYYLDIFKDIEEVDFSISFLNSEPIFCGLNIIEKKISIVPINFFIKNRKIKYRLLLKMDTDFFNNNYQYTKDDKDNMKLKIKHELYLFLKNIQKSKEIEYEKEKVKTYLA